jgi:hypothetical protein
MTDGRWPTVDALTRRLYCFHVLYTLNFSERQSILSNRSAFMREKCMPVYNVQLKSVDKTSHCPSHTVSLSFPHSQSTILLITPFLSQSLPVWLTNQDLLASNSFSSLPCRLMRERQTSYWLNIHSQYNSSIPTQSRMLPSFCKPEHNPSVIVEQVIKS